MANTAKSQDRRHEGRRPAEKAVKHRRHAPPQRNKMFGPGDSSAADLIRRIEAGMPFGWLESLRAALGLSLDEVAHLVRIPVRTVARRRSSGRLSPDESDKLVRVANVYQAAVDLFEGDTHGANQWLRRSQPGLGGATPLEFARTDVGARAVHDLISRIEHGVFW